MSPSPLLFLLYSGGIREGGAKKGEEVKRGEEKGKPNLVLRSLRSFFEILFDNHSTKNNPLPLCTSKNIEIII